MERKREREQLRIKMPVDFDMSKLSNNGKLNDLIQTARGRFIERLGEHFGDHKEFERL